MATAHVYFKKIIQATLNQELMRPQSGAKESQTALTICCQITLQQNSKYSQKDGLRYMFRSGWVIIRIIDIVKKTMLNELMQKNN